MLQRLADDLRAQAARIFNVGQSSSHKEFTANVSDRTCDRCGGNSGECLLG
jgi:hypothetical protein